jgi:type IV secretion system protein VirD4
MPRQTNTKASDDWSGLPIPTSSKGSDQLQLVSSTDPANGGIRREPELPEHEDVVPNIPRPVAEFAFEDDAGDEAVRSPVMRRHARGLARQAAMDPNDGIDL